MHLVTRFHSPVIARHALMALLEAGYPTRLHHPNTDVAMIGSVSTPGPIELLVASKADAEPARAVLERLEADLAEGLDDDWEDQSTPDLSRLDPGLAPPCPSCTVPLPLDAACERCPSCQEPVDPVGLILETHGPDALADAYASPGTSDLDPARLDRLAIVCSDCSYSLRGMSPQGQCPECGTPYDKQAILARLLEM